MAARKVNSERDAKILADLGAGMKPPDIAKKYGIKKSVIYTIRRDARLNGVHRRYRDYDTSHAVLPVDSIGLPDDRPPTPTEIVMIQNRIVWVLGKEWMTAEKIIAACKITLKKFRAAIIGADVVYDRETERYHAGRRTAVFRNETGKIRKIERK